MIHIYYFSPYQYLLGMDIEFVVQYSTLADQFFCNLFHKSKIFPAFKILFGSNAFFISRINLKLASRKIISI